MKELAPGVEIGPFRILRLLGEGGVGRVYAALDTDLGRSVALKALRPELSHDASFVDRFKAEAANLARLQHSNITTLYSLHRDGRDLYMVMELVRGYTLEEILAREGRLTADAVRAVAAQACAGLGYAHRMGIIHRDIKTANLMLTESGELKIMDFGIARVRGTQRMTRAGNIIGTLEYMPPEQIKGADNDERSDIYSLAIVFYELLCGSTPFRCDNEYELMQAQRDKAPPALSGRCRDLDPSVEAALDRALSKAPDARFKMTGDFARALGATGLPREPADMVRDVLLSRLPPPPDLRENLPAASPGKAGAGAGATRIQRKPAAPEVLLANGSTAGRRSALPGSAILFGGAAVLALAGLAAFVMLGVSSPSPQLAATTPADSSARAERPERVAATDGVPSPGDTTDPGVPRNPDILNLPGTQHAEIEIAKSGAAAGTEQTLHCAANQHFDGHVDTVSETGWPELNGCEMHLFAVANLGPSAQQRLSAWLAGKGSEITCQQMQNGERQCETLTTPRRDLSRYLLRNGLAEAEDGAPPAYFEEQDKAKADHVGRWQ